MVGQASPGRGGSGSAETRTKGFAGTRGTTGVGAVLGKFPGSLLFVCLTSLTNTQGWHLRSSSPSQRNGNALAAAPISSSVRIATSLVGVGGSIAVIFLEPDWLGIESP